MAKTNAKPMSYRAPGPNLARVPSPPTQPEPTPPPSPALSTSIPGWAILPLRFFLGISFLAAGLDKLTDPTYLDPSALSYIGKQIAGFAPGTPLEGFLLNFAVPNAQLFGVMVMGGELCIGIAVLLGLFTRFSAAMGLLLNLTFFLSATWSVRPFYFGADLPYVFGWLTLLLAGPGPFALDILVKRWLTPAPITYASKGRMITVEDSSTVMTRRAVLGAGAAGLTAVALVASGLSWGILNAGKSRSTASVPPGGSPTQVPTPVPQATSPAAAVAQDTATPASAPPGEVAQATATETPQPAAQQNPEPTATTAPAPSGLTKVAGPGDVPVNQSLDFSLPTGQPAVLVHTDSGYSAYVAICTHEGCKVAYYPDYKIIGCPCHGAEFDAANNGQVLRGPARRPLSSIPLTVGPDGAIYLSEG